MLTVTDQRFAQGPAGMRRRDFLRIGGLGGTQITDAGVAELKQALPNLQIEK